eukprot:gene1752-2727_t
MRSCRSTLNKSDPLTDSVNIPQVGATHLSLSNCNRSSLSNSRSSLSNCTRSSLSNC